MNYVTNYYKNLSEQLQEKVNVLQYKVKQLNEMRAPPYGAADDIVKVLELLFKQVQDGRITIEKFIEKFQSFIAQHPSSGEEGLGTLWRTWDFMRDHPDIMRFIRMNPNGDFLIQQVINGKTYHWFRTQSGKIFRIDEHGHIIFVKEAKDSPFGRIVNGEAKPKDPKAVERPTVDGGVQNSPPRSPKDGGRTPPGQSYPEPIE
jgi:hypothetical protein